ncbi:transglycosylase SLT domain-containing protein [Streptomyces sp. NPDC004111]|uniref:transglycosylase SLT domain-containing protein n=1 Tax=Streptomyces sp. NPDC004111 TaxID=3364690 RepID=UPI00367AEC5D
MSATPGHSRLTKTHRVSIAGVAALGAASLALTLLPGGGSAEAEAGTQEMASTAVVVSQGSTARESIAKQHAVADKQARDAAAAKAKVEAAKAKKAQQAKQAKAEADAKKRAEAKQAASRAAARKPVYTNNLDGWIREALDVMRAKGIPGSYDGLHRNIMRESTGNPRAMNGWDVNAQNGTPSIGLLQVIQPTFNAYHVPGTAHDIYDPVSNITAAANYAAARYGSIDNVNGAY